MLIIFAPAGDRTQAAGSKISHSTMSPLKPADKLALLQEQKKELLKSSLIWVCAVCPGLFGRQLAFKF